MLIMVLEPKITSWGVVVLLALGLVVSSADVYAFSTTPTGKVEIEANEKVRKNNVLKARLNLMQLEALKRMKYS